MGSIIVADLIALRTRIKKKFRQVNALSEENAVGLEELKLEKREIFMFKNLLKHNQIKKTADGRYYWSTKDC
jgi:hypothetical protein